MRIAYDSDDYGHRGAVEAIIDDLRALSGLDIRLVTRSEMPNVLLRYEWTGGCWMRGESTTRVVIANDRRDRCLPEEMAQLIGPTNDTCLLRPSIFFGQDKELTELTWTDRLVMKATFDSRLRDMMPKAEAMPIARVVIRELYDAWERGERF